MNIPSSDDFDKVLKKRERNRIASNKCRFKKIERIKELEDQVERLKREKSELSEEVETLKEDITSLRSKLDEHKETGFCQIDFFDQITGSKRHFGWKFSL